MEISTTQFQERCLQFVEDVHVRHTEIVITKHGKPWAKLIAADENGVQPFLGSFVGIGATVDNLLEPFEDEWEYERW